MTIKLDFALFNLGQLAVTQGAMQHKDRLQPVIAKHACGDWGELDKDDVASNMDALADGGRLLSCHPINPDRSATGQNRLYVITEADRSVTTVLLPEEY